MKHFPSFAETAIERILELSADLQIRRRNTSNGSLAYRNFSAAIAAYGEVLDVLTTLQHEREVGTAAGLVCPLPSALETRAIL